MELGEYFTAAIHDLDKLTSALAVNFGKQILTSERKGKREGKGYN